jgi:hypothetical protein
MIPYHGPMSEAHLRAVVRLALRGHGFDMDRTSYDTALREYWQTGTSLRDSVLPERLPGFIDASDYFALADTDPYLWARLPWIAATGFYSVEVFRRAADLGDSEDATPILGAAFLSAIVLLDFLIDERGKGDDIFRALDAETIARLFAGGSGATASLEPRYRGEPDSRVRVLFALICMCSLLGQEALARSGNVAAWDHLARVVMRMYAAQRATSDRFYPSHQEALRLLPALKAKSALPEAAVACIAALPQRKQGIPGAWLSTAAILGRIYWKMDDLLDLLSDSHRGVPSALLIRLAGIAAQSGRRWAADGDIYDVVDRTCRDVVRLLELGADAQENLGNQPGPHARGRCWLVPGALQFARVRVATWGRWEEEPPHSEVLGTTCRGEVHDSPLSKQLAPATHFLLEQQATNYREAVHRMTLPRARGQIVQMETHSALLFQRAVILDALLDARRVSSVSQAVIASEAMTMLRAKHRGVRGGWSYIPEVPELAPDADDLGVVLHALSRIGGRVLAETCEEAIALALEASGGDGAFPTWVLDPLGASKADEDVRAYLGIIGGKGIHPEVVATLLDSLHEYDNLRFRDVLQKGVNYLEASQHDSGLWPSRWYARLFYGTYRAVCCLAKVDPHNPALERARCALLAMQNRDGGWGNEESDPLSTSFAILTLGTAGASAGIGAPASATTYLVTTQERDGGWPSSVRGHFETGSGLEAYGSRTIVTAFCLKALLTVVSTYLSYPHPAAGIHVGSQLDHFPAS